jgi:2-polyprenyl-6-methoxyphenol hydroxylase-like FAD-dependent oxidoreductase
MVGSLRDPLTIRPADNDQPIVDHDKPLIAPCAIGFNVPLWFRAQCPGRKRRRPMRRTDVAIIGGGLGGSAAAAMLGRAGIDSILVDPHTVYPPDFRCEKLDLSQVELVRKAGLGDIILPAAVLDGEVSVARFGRLVERRPNRQYGILYDRLVNTVRADIPDNVPFLAGKATAISTSADRQHVTLSNGEEISARLIVLANGLNIGLRYSLGLEREILSECHSISIGFDLAPTGRAHFDFRALTYFPQHAEQRLAYLTLFPVSPEPSVRANLFCYRDMHDPWLRLMRTEPHETLHAAMPGLDRLLGNFEVIGPVKVRPVDLTVTTGHRQAGIVLIGDAFATSCPAAGTGTNKVFTDVERLCNTYIGQWLASDGMSADKIAAFYDDPVKQACEEFCLAKAFYLRELSTATGLAWTARRWAKFLGHWGFGRLRSVGEQLSLVPQDRDEARDETQSETRSEPVVPGVATPSVVRRAAGE